MTSHTTQIPTSEETPPPIPRQEYAFLCHGCNIVLRQVIRHHNKREYVGQGYCIGCQYRTEDGYIMRLAIMDDINEEREKMKKEDFWQKSRAEGDRRREVRIRELRAQSSRQS